MKGKGEIIDMKADGTRLYRADGSGSWCCGDWRAVINEDGPSIEFHLGLPIWNIAGGEIEVDHCPFCGKEWETAPRREPAANGTLAKIVQIIESGGQRVASIESSTIRVEVRS